MSILNDEFMSFDEDFERNWKNSGWKEVDLMVWIYSKIFSNLFKVNFCMLNGYEDDQKDVIYD